MKYAIYDKATDGYLTKMEFEVGYSKDTQFSCALTEYIINAKLLCTNGDAAAAVARIKGFKFMKNDGRFVIHSFDDTLNDQYIISEAGNPTKVVDNITVDLNGTVNVKYGTMMSHWSTISLNDAVDRMNTLQKAASAIYTSWNNTFDIYKVVTIMDEKEHTHFQFIKVTEKGLDSAKEEEKNLIVGKDITDITDPLNKRIEELEKDNAMLTDGVNYHNECRVVLSEIIRAIKLAVCSKDSDKRANYISYITDKIKNNETFNRPDLKTAKNDIPKICKHLTELTVNPLSKHIEELEKTNYELGQSAVARGILANRLQEENDNLKTKVEHIKKEARDWKNLYKKAYDERAALMNVIDNIYDDLHSDNMCEDLKDTYNYVHNFSKLHNIKIHNHNDDTGMPIYITANVEFRCIIDKIITIIESRELNQSVAFSSVEDVKLARDIANDIISICEPNDKFEMTLKKFSELYEAVNAVYNTKNDPIIHAFNSVLLIFSTMEHELEKFAAEIVECKIKAQKAEKVLEEWKRKCKAKNTDYSILENKLKACEIILDSTHNILIVTTKERDKALEQKEFYKRQANSVYGMTVPTRCCGKQIIADILSGKKILVDKRKYDDLVEYVANINLTYDTMFCPMDKPVYLFTITESINDLTK